MYSVKKYNPMMDLTDFYEEAAKRGFENNANPTVMAESFNHLDASSVWILYWNDTAMGSVVCHSLEETPLGDAYRIGARTCLLTGISPNNRLHTRNQIKTHQGPAPQVLLPVCMEWAGFDKDLYISSNDSPIATQQHVHRFYCPLLRSVGILEDPVEIDYRNEFQYFWKVNTQEFYKQLEEYWWDDCRSAMIQWRKDYSGEIRTPWV